MSAATTPRRELREDGAFVFHHPPKHTWAREQLPPPLRWGSYSVYLHVPFCRRICVFCTFERKRLRRGAIDELVARLWRELAIRRDRDDFSQAAVRSVYLGGGTASLLPNDAVGRFLEELRDGFGLAGEVEVTLECDPGTKREADFRALRAMGVTRVSVGLQAFQDDLLRTLNRAHDVAKAVETVEAARAAGIPQVHVDLMYGLPGQTTEMWEETVARTAALGVDHVSAYQLIVFESELLARMIRVGEAQATPPSEIVHAMRRHVGEVLEAAGLRRYSLTEFARPGARCDYVTTTWDGSDYLGFGPAAYSRNGSWVWENEIVHLAYERALAAGRPPAGRAHRLTPTERLERDLAMGLCLLAVDVASLEARSGASLDALAAELAALERDGLVRRVDGRVELTEDGRRYSTHVAKCLTDR